MSKDAHYSRQLLVLGGDAQSSLSSSDVVVLNLDGVGLEVCKNLVLMGVRTLYVHDTQTLTQECMSYMCNESCENVSGQKCANPAVKRSENVSDESKSINRSDSRPKISSDRLDYFFVDYLRDLNPFVNVVVVDSCHSTDGTKTFAGKDSPKKHKSEYTSKSYHSKIFEKRECEYGKCNDEECNGNIHHMDNPFYNRHLGMNVSRSESLLTGNLLDFLRRTKVSCVVSCNLSNAENIFLNELSNEIRSKMVVCNTDGVFSRVFVDFGDTFTVTDDTGESAISGTFCSVSNGLMVLVEGERHGLSDGDLVRITVDDDVYGYDGHKEMEIDETCINKALSDRVSIKKINVDRISTDQANSDKTCSNRMGFDHSWGNNGISHACSDPKAVYEVSVVSPFVVEVNGFDRNVGCGTYEQVKRPREISFKRLSDFLQIDSKQSIQNESIGDEKGGFENDSMSNSVSNTNDEAKNIFMGVSTSNSKSSEQKRAGISRQNSSIEHSKPSILCVENAVFESSMHDFYSYYDILLRLKWLFKDATKQILQGMARNNVQKHTSEGEKEPLYLLNTSKDMSMDSHKNDNSRVDTDAFLENHRENYTPHNVEFGTNASMSSDQEKYYSKITHNSSNRSRNSDMKASNPATGTISFAEAPYLDLCYLLSSDPLVKRLSYLEAHLKNAPLSPSSIRLCLNFLCLLEILEVHSLFPQKDFVNFLAFYNNLNENLVPIISTIGGFVSQEVIKGVTHKFTPLQQFMYYNSLESLFMNFSKDDNSECVERAIRTLAGDKGSGGYNNYETDQSRARNQSKSKDPLYENDFWSFVMRVNKHIKLPFLKNIAKENLPERQDKGAMQLSTVNTTTSCSTFDYLFRRDLLCFLSFNTLYSPFIRVYGIQNFFRIINSKVVVMGAGAIGCELLKNFCLTGIGMHSLSVVDCDSIEISNLSRQFLFRKNDVGKLKADEAIRKVHAMNSDYVIERSDEVNKDVPNSSYLTHTCEKWLNRLTKATLALDNYSVDIRALSITQGEYSNTLYRDNSKECQNPDPYQDSCMSCNPDSINYSNNLSPMNLRQNNQCFVNSSTKASKAGLIALTTRVDKSTTNVYTNNFFNSSTLIANALDNVESRIYIDGRCTTNKIPLFESGTLGTKGNTQVIIPNLYENYSASIDPPEKEIPMCTLRNFPYTTDHCIEYAVSEFKRIFQEDIILLETLQQRLNDTENSPHSFNKKNNKQIPGTSQHTDIQHTNNQITDFNNNRVVSDNESINSFKKAIYKTGEPIDINKMDVDSGDKTLYRTKKSINSNEMDVDSDGMGSHSNKGIHANTKSVSFDGKTFDSSNMDTDSKDKATYSNNMDIDSESADKSVNTDQHLEDLTEDEIRVLRMVPYSKHDCLAAAFYEYNQAFNIKIKKWLITFPKDHLTAEGTKFWSFPKKAPRAIQFSGDNDDIDFILNYCIIFARCFGMAIEFEKNDVLSFYKKYENKIKEYNQYTYNKMIQQGNEEKKVSAAKEILAINASSSSNPISEIHMTDTSIDFNHNNNTNNTDDITDNNANSNELVIPHDKMSYESDNVSSSISENVRTVPTYHELPQDNPFWPFEHCKIKIPTTKLTQTEFEKDNDIINNLVTAYTNKRASNYKINKSTKENTRKIAGKIIPAIATTTAMVAGLISNEIIKYLSRNNHHKNHFISLGIPFIGASEPINPKKNTYYITTSQKTCPKDCKQIPETKKNSFEEILLEDEYIPIKGKCINMNIQYNNESAAEINQGHIDRFVVPHSGQVKTHHADFSYESTRQMECSYSDSDKIEFSPATINKVKFSDTNPCKYMCSNGYAREYTIWTQIKIKDTTIKNLQDYFKQKYNKNIEMIIVNNKIIYASYFNKNQFIKNINKNITSLVENDTTYIVDIILEGEDDSELPPFLIIKSPHS